jgi:excinuclease ABC subunit C
MFMEGRSQALLRESIKKMECASDQQDYEAAAVFRDRIAIFKRIQERQYISGRGGDADVLAVAVTPELACVAVTFIRNGQNLGSKAFFPRLGAESSPGEVLSAFMPQYYLSEMGTSGRIIPPHLYLSEPISDINLLESGFSQYAGKKIAISHGRRGAARRWVQMARVNANESLRRKLADKLDMRSRFDALRDALALEATPERMECFDVSHTMGEETVASCVVFDISGPVKSDYRRFNIRSADPGDDYGALAQALTRRYRRVKEGGGRLPDLLIIDGGKGQLSTAEAVLQELQLEGVKLMAVAKGRERKPGREKLFMSGSSRGIALLTTSPALHLIQQIRDEAHRFAITGHRVRRGKARTTSALEGVAGIGSQRRQALLKNFGGLREVARAGVEDLARVPGISPKLAQKIYDTFHQDD